MIDSFKPQSFDELNVYTYWENSDIIVWSAKLDKKWSIILNNKSIWSYDYVDYSRTTTSDYTKYLCKVTNDGISTLVINWKEIKLNFGLDYFLLSPDWKRIAFVLTDADGNKFVQIWNKKFKKYTQINYLTFSPDSKQLLYVWTSEDWKNTVVSNWKDYRTYDSVYYIYFSLSWKHTYYTATSNGKEFVIVDWVEQKKYDSIQSPYYLDDENTSYIWLRHEKNGYLL